METYVQRCIHPKTAHAGVCVNVCVCVCVGGGAHLIDMETLENTLG